MATFEEAARQAHEEMTGLVGELDHLDSQLDVAREQAAAATERLNERWDEVRERAQALLASLAPAVSMVAREGEDAEAAATGAALRDTQQAVEGLAELNTEKARARTAVMGLVESSTALEASLRARIGSVEEAATDFAQSSREILSGLADAHREAVAALRDEVGEAVESMTENLEARVARLREGTLSQALPQTQARLLELSTAWAHTDKAMSDVSAMLILMMAEVSKDAEEDLRETLEKIGDTLSAKAEKRRELLDTLKDEATETSLLLVNGSEDVHQAADEVTSAAGDALERIGHTMERLTGLLGSIRLP